MVDEARHKALQGLPAVEELAGSVGASALREKYPRAQVVEAIRTVIEAARTAILEGSTPSPVEAEDFLAEAGTLLASWARPGLRRVLNLTGVVIHTNLGRSCLAESAVERVAEVARSYNNLEYDLKAGARGARETHVETLLTRLTGAEAAFAVNNNAGAVLLLLMGLAAGREVLVSRGQLVEIGGSFRLPDIMRAGGVRLVEVGTTNRTRIEDYETAITADTALLLRVHTSNYRIMGFAEETGLDELVALGRHRGVAVADDLGSGALLELEAFAEEPTVAASLRAGVDVVCFSGDKLLGGPQAGILLGRSEAIDRLRKHPVARAVRLDKMTLAALEATLLLYADPQRARREIPTLRSLSRTPAETAALAVSLQAAIERRCADGFILEVEESTARAGGGSMPLAELPSHTVRIRIPEPPVESVGPGGTARPAGAAGGPGGSTGTDVGVPRAPRLSASALEAELRRAPTPLVARVSQDSLHLDVLALDEEDIEVVAETVSWAAERVVAAAAAPRPVPRVGR
ncbi:MAG: L-seryl-tRNA(Sec) selenium transferase [bacterium]